MGWNKNEREIVMKKPSVFRIDDLLSFGLISVAAISVAIFLQPTNAGAEAKALVWVVSLVFLGIYVRVVHLRAMSLKNFEWFPKFGIMVDKDEWEGDIAGLDDLVKSVAEKWEKTLGYDSFKILQDEVVWVYFKPEPITRIRNKIVSPKSGYMVARGYDLVIGYKEKNSALESTAFAHELGHLIQGHATGEWDETTHHERAKTHGLP